MQVQSRLTSLQMATDERGPHSGLLQQCHGEGNASSRYHLFIGTNCATKPPSRDRCTLSMSPDESFRLSMLSLLGSCSASGASFQIVALWFPAPRKASGRVSSRDWPADMPPTYHELPLRRATTSNSPT